MTDSPDAATVAESLRLEGDFSPDEFADVVERFGSLENRLRSFPSGSVVLVLAMKERDQASQRTTLEADVIGQPRLMATSVELDRDAALIEVRDDLIRQLTDRQNRGEPRQNRQLRENDPS